MSTEREQTVKWIPFTEREPDMGATDVLTYSTVGSTNIHLHHWWNASARDYTFNVRSTHWCQVIKPELPR